MFLFISAGTSEKHVTTEGPANSTSLKVSTCIYRNNYTFLYWCINLRPNCEHVYICALCLVTNFYVILQKASGGGVRVEDSKSKEESSVKSSDSNTESTNETYLDIIDIAGMDYSSARRKPPIHNWNNCRYIQCKSVIILSNISFRRTRVSIWYRKKNPD